MRVVRFHAAGLRNFVERSMMRALSVSLAVLLGTFASTRLIEAQDISGRLETQLVAMYIGATDCGPCLTEETKALVREFNQRISDVATENEWEFYTIGVAVDWDVQAGFDLLRSTDDFDEVAVGRQWMNAGAIKYIWSDPEVMAAIPQVLAFRRTTGRSQKRLAFGEPEVLVRLYGPNAMKRWLEEGAGLQISSSN